MLLHRTSKYFAIIVSVILAALTAMSPFAIDTYLPAMPDMATAFGVSIQKIQLSITVYFLGFALGNFIGGPLSDSFGRKPIALTGIILYGLSAILIPIATKIEIVWLLRFTQAFGGGFSTVTVMVFVKDWFEGKQVARMATIIGMIMMLAPLFAPIIGTVLIKNHNWQNVFYFLALFALFLLALISIVIPESRSRELITKKLSTKQLIGKYTPFFKSKKAIYMLLSVSFSSAGMFVFITTASFLYITYYGYSETMFPLLFGANVVLNIVFSFLNTLFLKRYEPETILRTGLIFQFVASLAIVGTIIFMDKPMFEIVFAAIVLFIGALGLVFGNATASILNLLPEISGSANATLGLSRFVISFIAASIPALFEVNSISPIGFTMFGCSVIAVFFLVLFKRVKH